MPFARLALSLDLPHAPSVLTRTTKRWFASDKLIVLVHYCALLHGPKDYLGTVDRAHSQWDTRTCQINILDTKRLCIWCRREVVDEASDMVVMMAMVVVVEEEEKEG